MTRGLVTDRRAAVNLILRLPNAPDLAIEFEVDTGFRGALAIPADAVAALQLPFVMEMQTLPASGIPFQAGVYQATILWEDRNLLVPVLAMGIRPILGTALLQGHDLAIEYTEGGAVRIEPRP